VDQGLYVGGLFGRKFRSVGRTRVFGGQVHNLLIALASDLSIAVKSHIAAIEYAHLCHYSTSMVSEGGTSFAA
jgi:hypothetical protein